MGKKTDETVELFGKGEARDIFMWPRAELYRIIRGEICAVGERREEDDYRNLDRRSPLSNPRLFQSFARLASHNGPSDNRILRWVHQHGLLRRKDPQLDGDAIMRDGGVCTFAGNL